jgi:hypothetical protein
VVVTTGMLRNLVRLYDRRGALLAALMDGLSPWLRDGEPPTPDDDEIRASVEQMNDDFTEASNGWALARADLARALPVVEAAERVVADWSDSDLDDNSDHPLWNRLDALARALKGE